MKRILLIIRMFVVASLISTGLSAQTASSTPEQVCPTLSVNAPDNVNEGSSFFVTANVAGGDPKVTPTYNWLISAGTISKGQGTSTIEVATNGLGTQTITATVEIGGFVRTCASTYSASAYVVPRPAAKKFKEFGALPVKATNDQLDNFAIELQNNPGTQGYIIAYGGRRSSPEAGQKTAESAKKYLVNERQMDANSLVTVDGGYKEDVSTELWIVPAGALRPTASPTIDPSDLKSTTPVPKPSTRSGKKPN